MVGERGSEGVDRELATAVGVYALTDATLNEATAGTDLTAWELEAAVERAGLAEALDLDGSGDVSETIDELFEP